MFVKPAPAIAFAIAAALSDTSPVPVNVTVLDTSRSKEPASDSANVNEYDVAKAKVLPEIATSEIIVVAPELARLHSLKSANGDPVSSLTLDCIKILSVGIPNPPPVLFKK